MALGSANGPGLAALLKAARVDGGTVRGQDIAFGVAPRLNAVGRMGGAEDAVRLLLARDAAEADGLMARVELLNQERRQIQRELAMTLEPPDGEPFDLVVEPTAHKGVIGIVAGQRMRESGRPSAVCTVLEGVAQCSLRAPEGYDLGELMDQARPFLASGGGHRAAAGMTFDLSRLPFVRQVFNRGAALQATNRGPAFLPTDGSGADLAPSGAALDTLEPFGQAFPPPLLVMEGRLAKPPQPFGQGHRKLFLEGMREPLTWFFADDQTAAFPGEGRVRLAATPQDQPRWGRSWIVDGPVGPESAEP
jgi:single-stranded-DNA-specific exonuclease